MEIPPRLPKTASKCSTQLMKPPSMYVVLENKVTKVAFNRISLRLAS